MGLSPSTDVKIVRGLNVFTEWDIKKWHEAVRNFEENSPSFGWSVNKKIYTNLLGLTAREADESWPIWDTEDTDKQSMLEIFCGLCIICRCNFKEKVSAAVSLFDFESHQSLRFNAFSSACKTTNTVICKMTRQRLPSDKLMQIIIKNAFKSADAVSNFTKVLTINSILQWALICKETFYIFSQWNTVDVSKTLERHHSKWREIETKPVSIYFKIPLIADDKQRQRQKHIFFMMRSPKMSEKKKAVDRRDKRNYHANASRKTSVLVTGSISEKIKEKKYKQYQTSEILSNFEEILKFGMTVLRDCRVTANSRLDRSHIVVKDVMALKQKFDSIDTDGNGTIDLAEFVSAFPDAFGGGHTTRIFQSMDTDKSGNIDFGELMTMLFPMATAKDKTLICSWLEHNNIDEKKIQMLRGLFQTLNDFKQIEDATKVPRVEMFAILGVSQSFFPFTLDIKKDQIFGGNVDDDDEDEFKLKHSYITLEQLIHILFERDYKEMVPTMLKWIAPRKLSDKQEKDLQLLFVQFDEDNSGEISLEEFIAAASRFGVKEEVVKSSFYCMDNDQTDSITFKEFKQFFLEVWDVGFASQ